MLKITATDLPRFMACNGSRLLGGITPLHQDTTHKEEGVAAHWLCEQDFKYRTADELVDRKAPNGIYITSEMLEYTSEYREAIKDVGQVEIDTSHSDGVSYSIGGRADHAFTSDTILVINDFKYGWSIVNPEMNWTLISHAAGWMKANPEARISKVLFRIYQPRPFHPEGTMRQWSLEIEEFLAFYNQLLRTLTNPLDQLCSGSHCHNCPSATQCPAFQRALMNAIDVSEDAFDSEIDNTVLSFMLTQTNRALEILKENYKAYEELALQRCRSGQVVQNYSVENVKSQTAWKEGVSVELIQALTGVDCRKKETVTPSQAKKLGVSEEIIKSLTHRPNKGFKLVNVDGAKRAEKLLRSKK